MIYRHLNEISSPILNVRLPSVFQLITEPACRLTLLIINVYKKIKKIQTCFFTSRLRLGHGEGQIFLVLGRLSIPSRLSKLFKVFKIFKIIKISKISIFCLVGTIVDFHLGFKR